VDIENSQDSVNIGKDGNIYFGFNDVKYVGDEPAHTSSSYARKGVDISSPEALAEEVKARSKEWSKENASSARRRVCPSRRVSLRDRLSTPSTSRRYTPLVRGSV
jgi:hypothetical protein